MATCLSENGRSRKLCQKISRASRSIPVFDGQFHQGTGDRRLVIPVPGGADAVMPVGDDQVDALAALAADQQHRRNGPAFLDVLESLMDLSVIRIQQMGLAGAQYVLGLE